MRLDAIVNAYRVCIQCLWFGWLLVWRRVQQYFDHRILLFYIIYLYYIIVVLLYYIIIVSYSYIILENRWKSWFFLSPKETENETLDSVNSTRLRPIYKLNFLDWNEASNEKTFLIFHEKIRPPSSISTCTSVQPARPLASKTKYKRRVGTLREFLAVRCGSLRSTEGMSDEPGRLENRWEPSEPN